MVFRIVINVKNYFYYQYSVQFCMCLYPLLKKTLISLSTDNLSILFWFG